MCLVNQARKSRESQRFVPPARVPVSQQQSLLLYNMGRGPVRFLSHLETLPIEQPVWMKSRNLPQSPLHFQVEHSAERDSDGSFVTTL
jgi:hypothetical protein